MSSEADPNLNLYSEQYHERLANPGESFSAHYARHYSDLVGRSRGECVLEIGCAAGRTTELLLEMGLSVTALDFDERACAIARDRVARFGERATVVCMSADMIDDFSGFEKVTMLDFIEHVDDELLDRVLANMRATLQGELFVFTPNRNHPYEWAQRLHLMAGDPTHINVKSWRNWITFFESRDFLVTRTAPATSHPRWLSRIERPFLRVPVLNRVMVRSIGMALRAQPS